MKDAAGSSGRNQRPSQSFGIFLTRNFYYILYMGVLFRGCSKVSSDEPIVAGGPRAVAGRKIPPRCTRSQDPENAVEHARIIDTRHAARLGTRYFTFERR